MSNRHGLARDGWGLPVAGDGWTLTVEPLRGRDKYVRFALRGPVANVTPGERAALRVFQAPGGWPAIGVDGGIEVSWEEAQLIRGGRDPRHVLWPPLRARALTLAEMMSR